MWIGLDFGVEQCRVAYCDNGKSVLIPSEYWNEMRTFYNIDGRRYSLKQVMDPKLTASSEGSTLSIEKIGSQDLLKMKRSVETYLKTEIQGVVICVPVSFADKQRDALHRIGTTVGFKHVALLDEPTAAALSYKSRSNWEGKTLIFSLGASTFSVSAYSLSGSKCTPLWHNGDRELGGLYFDFVVAKLIRDILEGRGYRLNAVPNSDLMDAAKQIKEALSEQDSVDVQQYLHYSHTFLIKRQMFEEGIEEKIDRMMKDAMEAAEKADGVEKILLVGQSTRIPIIVQRLTDMFHIQPERLPEEALVKGAALYIPSVKAHLKLDTPSQQDVEPQPAPDVSEGASKTILSLSNLKPQTQKPREKTQDSASLSEQIARLVSTHIEGLNSHDKVQVLEELDMKLKELILAAYIAWGNALAQEGHYENSIKYFMKGLNIDPNNSDVKLGLSSLHLQLGIQFFQTRRDKARYHLKQSLRYNKNNATAQTHLDQIDRKKKNETIGKTSFGGSLNNFLRRYRDLVGHFKRIRRKKKR